GEDLDRGGLAGPVRAEQAKDRAAPHGDAEAVEGLDRRGLAAAARVGLDQVLGRDGGAGDLGRGDFYHSCGGWGRHGDAAPPVGESVRLLNRPEGAVQVTWTCARPASARWWRGPGPGLRVFCRWKGGRRGG